MTGTSRPPRRRPPARYPDPGHVPQRGPDRDRAQVRAEPVAGEADPDQRRGDQPLISRPFARSGPAAPSPAGWLFSNPLLETHMRPLRKSILAGAAAIALV